MSKLMRIKFYKHPILNDLEFDFCDVNGNPFDNIIIAGENGSGKSTLLSFIYDFFQNPMPREINDSNVELELRLTDKEIEHISQKSAIYNSFMDSVQFGNQLKIYIENTALHDYSVFKVHFLDVDKLQYIELNSSIMGQGIIDVLKVVFSDVEVNYNPKKITSTSVLEVDSLSFKAAKSTSDLATEITQLLIDIEALDSSDFAHWATKNEESKVSEGTIDRRMRRFKKAFEFMFENKKFKKVDNRAGEKCVLFEEFGREITINNLSSGEKQIVFRGSFLLRNKLTSESAIILIDEPEVSLHPKWQMKIIDFYKNLFMNEKGEQTSQIFFVTHSPFAIHNIKPTKDKIIILEKVEGVIRIQESPKYYGWTEEEAVKQAFDINFIHSQEKTVVFVEGITDEIYYKKAFEVLEIEQTNLDIKWIGRDEKGHKFTGDSALNQAREYLLSNKEQFFNRFILFYDSDISVKEQDYIVANVFIRQAGINKEATRFKKGTENMLVIPDGVDLEKFYIEKINQDGYGGSSKSLDKKALCNYICEEASLEEQKIWFSKFRELVINKIQQLAVGEKV